MGCGASTSSPSEEPHQSPAADSSKPPLKRSPSDPDMLSDEDAFDGAPPVSTQPMASRPQIDTSVPAEEEEGIGAVTDMDSPGGTRRAGKGPYHSTSTKLPVGAQSQRRFRKRSVNMEMLSEEQLKEIRASFDEIDTGGTGFIPQTSLSQILRTNYRPSEVETNQVMEWFDGSGEGHVLFDSYIVVMAEVMTRAGLTTEDGIERAREALSYEFQGLAQRDAAGAIDASPENVDKARSIVGESNLVKMHERWDGLDTSKQGYLEREQVQELIRLSYVPTAHTINAFMRVFPASEEGIARNDFVQGMTLLNGDFNFAIQKSTSSP